MPKRDIGKTIQQIQTGVSRVLREATHIAGVEAVNHFKASFRNQGFTDVSLIKWVPRKNDTSPGRAIEVKTGHERNAIRTLRESKQQVTVGIDKDEIPYAEIQNTGGTIKIPVTEKMRKYFWAQYYNAGGKQLNWKSMALTKKTELTVVIPQRKFIGESAELNRKIKEKIDTKLKEALG